MESQYYKIIDILIFDILLPSKGYDQTKKTLMEDIAMEKHIKTEYLSRLGEVYSESIRETSMMHGTEAIEMLNKARVKEQLKNRVDEIRQFTTVQQGNDIVEQDNPLLQATFNQQRQQERNQSQSESDKSVLNMFIPKFKSHVNKKTFMAIISIIIAFWLWRGGYSKIKRFKLVKFMLLHLFGIRD